VHYPAIHLLTLYRRMGFKPGDFPITEHIGRGIVTLPLFPAMREQDVERVCAETTRALQALSGRTAAASVSAR
jgi:dTDP-4-amino-4,6-dideoxygalactose transaminase